MINSSQKQESKRGLVYFAMQVNATGFLSQVFYEFSEAGYLTFRPIVS